MRFTINRSIKSIIDDLMSYLIEDLVSKEIVVEDGRQFGEKDRQVHAFENHCE
jgi:hypothetical protein